MGYDTILKNRQNAKKSLPAVAKSLLTELHRGITEMNPKTINDAWERMTNNYDRAKRLGPDAVKTYIDELETQKTTVTQEMNFKGLPDWLQKRYDTEMNRLKVVKTVK